MAGRGVTPMTAALRRTLAAHGVARRTGVPVEDVLAGGTASAAAGPSRRDVLNIAGVAVAGATLGGTSPDRRATPRGRARHPGSPSSAPGSRDCAPRTGSGG